MQDSQHAGAPLRADDLDTRLLRAMVIKGILEQITTATVNLVNADLLARNRGMRVVESTVPADGRARRCRSPRHSSLPCSQQSVPRPDMARRQPAHGPACTGKLGLPGLLCICRRAQEHAS